MSVHVVWELNCFTSGTALQKWYFYVRCEIKFEFSCLGSEGVMFCGCFEWNCFILSALKPLRPVIKNRNVPVNLAKLKANTYKWFIRNTQVCHDWFCALLLIG